MNRTLRRLAVAALTLAAAPATAHAQAFLLVFDGGQRTNKYANGPAVDADQFGMGIAMMLGGQSSAQTAFLMPVTADFRYVSADGAGAEVNADADFMMRVGPISGGLGMALRVPASHSYDWDCRQFEGCPASGTSEEDATEAIMGGLSYSAKLNFGPQGRFFVQGKVSDLSLAFDTRGSGQSCNDFGCYDTFKPEFLGGKETRVGAGFAWRGKIFRAAWTKQSASYERAQKNLFGDMDRKTSGWTVGMGWYM